jgi:hypothetical protein
MWRPSALFLLLLVACAENPDNSLVDVPISEAKSDVVVPGWVAEHVGPATGFVATVAFAPGGGIWISGDDADGFYRSFDGGASLAPVASTPLDWSTYRFAFSADGRRIVAPSYFGRGVAESSDGGATWRVTKAGVPQGAGNARRIFDAELAPDGRVLLATGSGLYRSDPTLGFAPVASPALATAIGGITQLLRTPTAYWAGSGNGRLYVSADGSAWTELTSQDGATISDLAAGRLGVYVASVTGLVVRVGPTGELTVIANPVVDARFRTSLWTRLAVAPLAATDRVFLGVVGDAAHRSAGKLFLSDDGGATFAERSNGLRGASIFSIAIDPANPAHVLVGTVGEGAFRTLDAGVSWTSTRGDLRAAAVLGFAQDPRDPTHLVIASSESLAGTPCLLERNGGVWSRRPQLLEDAAALAFDGGALLAGGFAGGPSMRRSATGPAGTFVAEAGVSGEVFRMVTTSKGIYAAGTKLSRRTLSGWTTVWPAQVSDVVDTPQGLISCGVGVYWSANGTFGDAVALPAPGRVWYACAINSNGELALTGGGELWTAPSLSAARTAAGWSRQATPIDGVSVLSVVSAGATWVIGGGDVDVGATVNSRSGVYAREPGGAWQAIDSAMWPSRTVYRLHRGSNANEIFAGLWGGGLWRLHR